MVKSGARSFVTFKGGHSRTDVYSTKFSYIVHQMKNQQRVVGKGPNLMKE
jgi:hypothetical protein